MAATEHLTVKRMLKSFGVDCEQPNSNMLATLGRTPQAGILMRHGVAVPIGEQINACQSWTKTALGPLRSLTAHLRPVRPLTAPGHGVVVGLTTERAEQMMSGVSVGGQLLHGVGVSGVNGLMMVEGRSGVNGLIFPRLQMTCGFDCTSSKNTFRRDCHSGDFQFHSHAMHFCKRVTCVSLFSCHGRMEQRHVKTRPS